MTLIKVNGIIMATEDRNGVWRTIRGRRVFIKDGESLEQALERSKNAYNSQDDSIRLNSVPGTIDISVDIRCCPFHNGEHRSICTVLR